MALFYMIGGSIPSVIPALITVRNFGDKEFGVMNGWMNSQGHRANILNKNYTTIGVGYYQNANGVGYWVQLFTY